MRGRLVSEREGVRAQVGRTVWPCWAEQARVAGPRAGERERACGPRVWLGQMKEGKQPVLTIFVFLFKKCEIVVVLFISVKFL
jgi:hypothetical protein